MKQQRGFTLLEVLIATVIMAIAVAGALSALYGSLFNAGRLTEVDRASMLARRKMEELLVETRLPKNVVLEGPYDPALTGGYRSGWRATVTPYEIPPNPSLGTPILDRVQVEIWWFSGEQRRTFVLDSYRRTHYTAQEIAAGALTPR